MLQKPVQVILFSLIFFPAYAQNIEVFEKRLSEIKTDTVLKIELLNILSREYTFINSKKSFDYASKALELSQNSGNSLGMAYSYRNLSGIYTLNEMYFQAMDFIQEAITIFKAKGDSSGVANCYISLAYLYRKLNNVDEELFYSRKAFNDFVQMNIPERIGVTAHNLGESFLNAGKLDSARILIRFAIRMNDSINNLSVLSSCYRVMGVIEYKYRNLGPAEEYFRKVLDISDELGINSQKTATVESYIYLARIYHQKKQNQEYLMFLNKAANYCNENKITSFLPGIYIDLMKYYSSNRNYEKLENYLNIYQNILDSINFRNLKDKSELVKSLIQAKDLEKENESLEQIKLLQFKSIRLRNLVIFISMVFLILMGLMVLKLLRANKHINQTNSILKQQNSTIEQQKAELLSLNLAKDKFFSIVAHDLRSPLSSLKSFSDLLNDQIEDLSKEEISLMNKHLYISVDNTLKMLDNLIQWAKIQMKQVDNCPVDILISKLFAGLCELYHPIAREKDVDITCSVPENLYLFGDENQIGMIVRNLLNNAIKFTHKGGKVHLLAKYLENEQVLISVSDTGKGISYELKDKLFTPSGRKSEPGTEGEQGTGMGLMLVYEFIRINNGLIKVESEEGKGSVFTLIFKGKEL